MDNRASTASLGHENYLSIGKDLGINDTGATKERDTEMSNSIGKRLSIYLLFSLLGSAAGPAFVAAEPISSGPFESDPFGNIEIVPATGETSRGNENVRALPSIVRTLQEKDGVKAAVSKKAKYLVEVLQGKKPSTEFPKIKSKDLILMLDKARALTLHMEITMEDNEALLTLVAGLSPDERQAIIKECSLTGRYEIPHGKEDASRTLARMARHDLVEGYGARARAIGGAPSTAKFAALGSRLQAQLKAPVVTFGLTRRVPR